LAELTQLIADKERTIQALETQVAAYGRSHLGILSGAAIRYELAQLTGPVDLVVFDWRKQNEWNAILGWNPANVFLGRAARVDYAGVDRRHTTRQIDLRGQYGGDEVVMAVDVGCGLGLFQRLLREVAAMNKELSPLHRAEILARTGGLVCGFSVAAVLVEGSTHALRDAARAIDATGELKKGCVTGERATSGARGSVLGRMPRC
jgi:hypothetical protein